jgi:hypothetical protein
VEIQNGEIASRTLFYRLQTPPSGTPTPTQPLAFTEVSSNRDRPYAFVGQIRSNLGSGSGFVVKPRVVATAAHMVFNDSTFEWVEKLQWLFQRDRNEFEPASHTPRGFYALDGYSQQRLLDNSPGESSPESQDLDVAALYFNDKEAGRKGYSGFLVSEGEDSDNEFLMPYPPETPALMILAGYPVDGITEENQGVMHATSPDNLTFTRGYGQTYLTDDITSVGGCSGGPLCVQDQSNKYYPAAIYLGGTGQTVVRAIDSDVVDLFNWAEVSANGGGNNTSGGTSRTDTSGLGSQPDPGGVVVVISEPGGAGWRLRPETGFRQSGNSKLGLSPGEYFVEFSNVQGYAIPETITLEVKEGIVNNDLTGADAVVYLTNLEAWREDHFDPTEDSGNDADPDGDGCVNIDEFVAGTNPNDGSDCFRVLSSVRVGVRFSVEVAGKAGRVYEMQLFEAPPSGNPADAGTWATVNTAGPLGIDATISLSDQANPATGALYRVRVTKP